MTAEGFQLGKVGIRLVQHHYAIKSTDDGVDGLAGDVVARRIVG